MPPLTRSAVAPPVSPWHNGYAPTSYAASKIPITCRKNRSSWSGKPKINNWECTPESDLSLPFSGRQQRLDFCQLLPPHSPTKASLVLGNALKPFQQNPLALLASGWARLGDLLIVMDGAANPAESHVSPI